MSDYQAKTDSEAHWAVTLESSEEGSEVAEYLQPEPTR
jgi:hypothetical protein